MRDGKLVERLVLRIRRGFVAGRVTTTKTGTERVVPVSDRLKAALPDAGDASELIAQNPHGRRWIDNSLQRRFNEAVKRAGVQGSWRLYDLRHFFCTTLFRAAVNPRAITALMGHADLTTTLRYAHVVDDDLFQAVERKEAFSAAHAVDTREQKPLPKQANDEPMGSEAA